MMFLRGVGIGGFFMNFCPYRPPEETGRWKPSFSSASLGERGSSYQNWVGFGIVAAGCLSWFLYYRSRPVDGVVLEVDGRPYFGPDNPGIPATPVNRYLNIEHCVVEKRCPGSSKREAKPVVFQSKPPTPEGSVFGRPSPAMPQEESVSSRGLGASSLRRSFSAPARTRSRWVFVSHAGPGGVTDEVERSETSSSRRSLSARHSPRSSWTLISRTEQGASDDVELIDEPHLR